MIGSRASKALYDVVKQQNWIDDHGGNLRGYIAAYGKDSGKVIYDADRAQLANYIFLYVKAAPVDGRFEGGNYGTV